MKSKKIIILGIILTLVFLLFCGCTEEDLDENGNDEKDGNGEQYSWSTMNEGPYNDRVSFATGVAVSRSDTEIFPDASLFDRAVYSLYAFWRSINLALISPERLKALKDMAHPIRLPTTSCLASALIISPQLYYDECLI